MQMNELKASGKNVACLPDVDTIVAHITSSVQPGDIGWVFSNGGFGGIHGKLPQRLGRM